MCNAASTKWKDLDKVENVCTQCKRERERKETRQQKKAHTARTPWAWFGVAAAAAAAAFLSVLSLLSLHSCFPTLSLECEATVSQFYPWISSDIYAYIERWSVGRYTSRFTKWQCLCLYLGVTFCDLFINVAAVTVTGACSRCTTTTSTHAFKTKHIHIHIVNHNA